MPSYKPTEAARILSDMTDRKVSPSTLRSWCSNNEVAPYLSDLATPPPGESRLLTDNDLAVLVRVQELRRQRLSFAEIGLKLADPGDSPTEATTEAADAPQTAIAPSVDIDTIAPLLAAISAQQVKTEEIHAINDRLDRLDQSDNQTRNILIAVLVAMVLVLVLVIVLILVLR